MKSLNLKNKKILLTGGGGFLGSFVYQELLMAGAQKKNITIPRSKTHDLRDINVCKKLAKNKDIIIHLAANVGGIGYNQLHPGSLFYDNLIMGAQVMEAARRAHIEKFVAIGTICAYPKHTPVPFSEKNLWNGYPEETNAPYGLAKKMLLVQSQAYRSEYGLRSIYLLPVNLYGPRDNFNPRSSHVIPALIKKIYEAKKNNLPEVVVWGTGRATREFLYVKDAAKAIVLATLHYDKPEPINLGSGSEISIKKLAQLIAKTLDYRGKIIWDTTKPDGQPRRKLNISSAKKEFGFSSQTTFQKGLEETIKWYTENYDQLS